MCVRANVCVGASLRARATADRLDVKYSNKIWLLVERLVGASVGFVGGAKGTARLFTHALTHRFGNGALCLCVCASDGLSTIDTCVVALALVSAEVPKSVNLFLVHFFL